jgi:hypothetical protein
VIIDREFRDVSSISKYPFMETAVMATTTGIPLPSDIFVDMILYVESLETVVYLTEVTLSGEGELIIIFKDSGFRNIIAEGVVPDGETSGKIKAKGVRAGTIVLSDTASEYLKGILLRGPVLFGNHLPVRVSRSFSLNSIGLRSVSVNNKYATGEFHIVCEQGVTAELEDSDVCLNLYGEQAVEDIYIKSINGITNEHFLITAKPNSSIKVVSGSQDNSITLQEIVDSD